MGRFGGAASLDDVSEMFSKRPWNDFGAGSGRCECVLGVFWVVLGRPLGGPAAVLGGAWGVLDRFARALGQIFIASYVKLRRFNLDVICLLNFSVKIDP